MFKRKLRIPKLNIPLIKVIRVFGLITLLILFSIFLYTFIPNFISSTQFQAQFNTDSVFKENSKEKITLFVITNASGDYEYITNLLFITQNQDKYKVVNFNPFVSLKTSVYGNEIQLDKTLQLSKLKKQTKGEYIRHLSDIFSIKIDKFVFIDQKFITSSLVTLQGVRIYNNYQNNLFKKGWVDINAGNYENILVANYDNDGQLLLFQNTFFKAYFSKLGSINGLLTAKQLNDFGEKYVSTNFSSKEFHKLMTQLILKSQEIEFNFIPSNTFVLENGKKYINNEKLDLYINSTFYNLAIKKEYAIVEVLNSSNQKGLATNFSRYISNSGAQVSRSGNFTFEVDKNTVYVKDISKFKNTLEYIKTLLGGEIEVREEGIDKLTTADLLVILKDF